MPYVCVRVGRGPFTLLKKKNDLYLKPNISINKCMLMYEYI